MTDRVHGALIAEAEGGSHSADVSLLTAVLKPMRTSVAKAALFKAAPFAEALFDWVDVHLDAITLAQVRVHASPTHSRETKHQPALDLDMRSRLLLVRPERTLSGCERSIGTALRLALPHLPARAGDRVPQFRRFAFRTAGHLKIAFWSLRALTSDI